MKNTHCSINAEGFQKSGWAEKEKVFCAIKHLISRMLTRFALITRSVEVPKLQFHLLV